VNSVTDDFADRFRSERYASDEPVTLTAGARTWEVPEGLFVRLQHLARAYELHLLPTLEIYDKTQLNGHQASALAEELAFIRDVVDDAALRPHLEACISLALASSRSVRPVDLVIEGP
jgi:hypothetical protein